jgi:hypothetical protein
VATCYVQEVLVGLSVAGESDVLCGAPGTATSRQHRMPEAQGRLGRLAARLAREPGQTALEWR